MECAYGWRCKLSKLITKKKIIQLGVDYKKDPTCNSNYLYLTAFNTCIKVKMSYITGETLVRPKVDMHDFQVALSKVLSTGYLVF